MLKIQDTHMPQPDFSAANEPKEIDFTGADEDNQPGNYKDSYRINDKAVELLNWTPRESLEDYISRL